MDVLGDVHVPGVGRVRWVSVLVRARPPRPTPIGRLLTETPGPFRYEYRIRDHADRVRHLVLVGVSEDSGGQVKRLCGYLVDITTTLSDEAQAAVAASAEHRAVIEQSKGILMAGFRLSDDAAFALVRKCSNEHDVRLANVSRVRHSRPTCARGSEPRLTAPAPAPRLIASGVVGVVVAAGLP